MMKKRVAIVSGLRTPFCKASGLLKDMTADDLGAYAVKELYTRANFSPDIIDEVILGNVLQPPHATNIARVIAVKAGIPESVPAYTVNRNCASGMEAVTSAANKILLGEADIILAGGVESMSHFPVMFSDEMRDFLLKMNKARGIKDQFLTLLKFRPSFLKPHTPELADPLCGLSMGQTGEKVSREFKVTREEQDLFALNSQMRAAEAIKSGRFKEEIAPIPQPPKYQNYIENDDGPRANTTIEGLSKLKPVFEKVNGTVTAGNSSQVTDGAAVLFVMSEEKAKSLGLKPLGYLTGFAEAGLDPSRMGLGPAYAIAKLFKETGTTLKDIDLIEINEAFAAQVIGSMRALASDDFCKNQLGLDKAVGEIDPNILNVNGGAISLGHPLGASGARLILTMLIELRKRNKKRGLAALCIGGGQGQACLLEVEND
jgi:acetyl-CoA acyltransferase